MGNARRAPAGVAADGQPGPDGDGTRADTRANTVATSVDSDAPPLNAAEVHQVDVIRRFGTVGALLLAIGSLGAAASPVFNPLTTVPVLGLFSRMPTVALALAFAGMAMLVLGWLWVGRLARPGRPRLISRSQLKRTMLTWTVPLLFVPPMFSKDVYSYLAQSKIAALGLNPYQLGPAVALGVADPLTRGVPTIWRDTPAPYGPLFITVGRAVTALSGDHVVTGVYLQRLLELVGIALIVWAVPRLARRFGVPTVSALWLGVANPLVLFHLIIGAHNEALMIGLMLTGFELALRHLPAARPGEPVPPVTRPELLWLFAGTAVITLGASVKISAAPAMGFLAMLVARRLGAKFRHLLLAAAGLFVVFAAITVAVSLGTGLGFGWITTLSTNSVVKSWESPVTGLGLLGGALGVAFGLGDHTDSTIGIMRGLGEILTVVVTVRLLWDTWRGRMQPMIGLGLCLGAVVLLGATVQAWYLLWAVIPLAAGLGRSRFRTFAIWLSAAVAMIVPPTGGSFDGHTYILPEAYAAAIIVVAVAIVAVRTSFPLLPWRDPATECTPVTGPDPDVG
ncbi:MAG TPA: polyprenol phosphomannose-dependent alpha 1,6 mannosyltransferase MptB [Pseudonocardiaceae bacterium]|jgi:alpha-1,6-mannosyltransferase|nr:polyprenol phosphomannose-dependent alpha 1,6 mannosyltransferase MptB [Pseudonocardiaceae bacterium]